MMVEYLFAFLLLFLLAVIFYLIYERLFQRSRRTESGLYIDALKDLLDGRQEAAFSKLRQVVAEDAGNIDAYLRLGQILRDNNQPARALQVHKDLTLRSNLNRDDKAMILRHIVLDSLVQNDLKMAEDALNELISISQDNHWAHSAMLDLYQKAQKWDVAYETAVKILQLEGNKSKKPLARFKYKAGEQLYKQREYHKSRVLCKEAIGLDPSLVEAYLVIGDSYRDEERYEDAVTFWRKLISAVPDQGHRVIERLKKTLFDLGRFGDIQVICESILEYSPKNLDARQALAEFYQKKGDNDLAEELWRGIVDDYPFENRSILELIRIYVEKGELRKIDQMLRTIEKKQEEQRERLYDSANSTSQVSVQT